MTTNHAATVRYTLKKMGLTADTAGRVPGLFIGDGELATIDALAAVMAADGVKGLVATIADGLAVHA